jgi:hypothetical protein
VNRNGQSKKVEAPPVVANSDFGVENLSASLGDGKRGTLMGRAS